MLKRGLTQAEIGLTQTENRPNSNFRRVVACTLQESAEKKPWVYLGLTPTTTSGFFGRFPSGGKWSEPPGPWDQFIEF